MWVSLIASLFFFSLLTEQQSTDNNIVCPFTNNTPPSDQKECARYTACVFTGTTCRMEDNDVAGYVVSAPPIDTERGYTMSLSKINPSSTLFRSDIQNPVFEVIHHEDHHLQIKIYDSEGSRYEVPYRLNLPTTPGSSPMYVVTTTKVGEPFTFNVNRKSTGASVFQLLGPLSFEDQFIQFTTRLASDYMYGFGENYHTSFKHQFNTRKTVAMFARDQLVTYENTEINGYGVQPYYVNIEDDDGNTHSVMFYNSNAMEYATFSLSDGDPALTVRSIGGIIDLHFFLGPMPEDVNKQYAATVGKSTFPPYYALGFHLSRYGYDTIQNARKVRERNKAMGIPMDVQTFDIDHMDRQMDFTYDRVDWEGLPEYIKELHDDGVKVTLIVDPALAIDCTGEYLPSVRAKEAGVCLRWSDPSLVPDDQVSCAEDCVIGYVWPINHKVYFPDFFYPNTTIWWSKELATLHETLPFDAIWIDMNEPTNFGTNLNRPFNYPDDLPDWSLKCPYNKYDNPPYQTMATFSELNACDRISDATVCLSGQRTDSVNKYMEYDVHNLYGLSESIATYKGLSSLFSGKRSLIYGRSTFVGSGQYLAHWLGDNFSQWDHLRLSIVGLLEFNLFAIPFVGADICGFNDVATDQLCTRWMQLGAFYPFSRNHNAIVIIDQDPAAPRFNTTGPIARKALELRYRYLPFMYQKFHEAHMYGNSVIRPLWNVFLKDIHSRNVDDQFLWGDSFMVAPIVYKDHTNRTVYFPKESNWYDIETGETVNKDGVVEEKILQAPLDKILVLVRGGAVLPFQEPNVTTQASRLNPFGLLFAGDSEGKSTGEIYWDDGESVMNMEKVFLATATFDGENVQMTTRGSPETTEGIRLKNLIFYGYGVDTTIAPSNVTVNGAPLNSANIMWDSNKYILTLSIDVPLGEDLSVYIQPTTC